MEEENEEWKMQILEKRQHEHPYQNIYSGYIKTSEIFHKGYPLLYPISYSYCNGNTTVI